MVRWCGWLVVCLLVIWPLGARAAAGAPVVMLSDVHFDPFHDPGKVAALRRDPVERWAAVLDAPATATQAADLLALQVKCGTRALDTAWPLLKTALQAAKAEQARPVMVTVSGDLLTHDFPCRFAGTSPDAGAGELASFAAKTVAFVMLEVRGAFPRVAVYGALGNNDSGCADYRETPGDGFVSAAAGAVAGGGAAVSAEGDYSVALPAPFVRGRLVVLEDIFETRQFRTCGGGASSAEAEQMTWLRAQLASARAHGEHVWVMAHVPPGVDVFSTYRRFLLQPAGMCGAEPKPFLGDTALPDALLDNADVVSLAVFGHTHMDEFRLLRRRAGEGVRAAAVAAKVVPSVTPIFGNHPAFLVATVDARTLVLRDWRTVVSPGPEGSSSPWTEAYRFSAAYHLPEFSAGTAGQLADGFAADANGQAPLSSTFRQHFFAGDVGLYALGLAQIWPAYACAIRESRPSAMQGCLCKAVPSPAASPSAE